MREEDKKIHHKGTETPRRQQYFPGDYPQMTQIFADKEMSCIDSKIRKTSDFLVPLCRGGSIFSSSQCSLCLCGLIFFVFLSHIGGSSH
jgi:hypothetical protein